MLRKKDRHKAVQRFYDNNKYRPSNPFVQSGGNDKLKAAIIEGDSTRIAELLTNGGININYPIDELGRTPLMLASLVGNAELVQWLIANGAELDEQTFTTITMVPNYKYYEDLGMTALLYACQQGYLDVVRVLVDNGADVSISNNPNGQTALMLANHHAPILEYLLNSGADVNATDCTLKTPLMYAVGNLRISAIDTPPINNNIDSIHILLRHGANIDATDFVNRSVLTYAVAAGNAAAVRRLLESHANIHTTDNEGNNLLMYAVSYGNVHSRRSLYVWYPSNLPHTPSYHDIVQLLIDAGIDTNTNSSGRSALMYAAAIGNPMAVELLIDTGRASAVERDHIDRTPLMYAVSKSNKFIVFEPGERDNIRPLSKHECIDLLIILGADMNAADHLRKTPLMYAIEADNIYAVRKLIEVGADVDAQDRNNATPLMYAVTSGNTNWYSLFHQTKGGKYTHSNTNHEIVTLLIASGADIRAIASNGYSALMYAIAADNIDAVRELSKYSANPQIFEDNGFIRNYVRTYLGYDIYRRLVTIGIFPPPPQSVTNG